MKKINKIVFALTISLIIFLTNTVYGFTIVLDPGHGGTDSGATASNGMHERDMNLKTALYLKQYLSNYNVKVYLTHDGYEGTYELIDRAKFARDKKADLLISMHYNDSSSIDYPAGAEVYVTDNKSLNKYNRNLTWLGEKILSSLNTLGIANRGVRTRICSDPTDVYSDGSRADYYGIIRYAMRGTKIDNGVRYPPEAKDAVVEKGEGVPAMIVEHCYVKGTDVQFFDSDEKIKKIAEADGKAIVDYYGFLPKGAKNPNTPFEDVLAEDWFSEAVEFVYKNGYIKGYDEITFAPNDKLTRGMLVTILYRMDGQKEVSGATSFPDVQDSKQYYYIPIKWAVDNKVISGYETGYFGPNDNITREQLAVILYRYALYKKKDVSPYDNLEKFSDRNSISNFAKEQVKWAVGAGVITGNANGTINPLGDATRAEVAAMLTKYCMRVGVDSDEEETKENTESKDEKTENKVDEEKQKDDNEKKNNVSISDIEESNEKIDDNKNTDDLLKKTENNDITLVDIINDEVKNNLNYQKEDALENDEKVLEDSDNKSKEENLK